MSTPLAKPPTKAAGSATTPGQFGLPAPKAPTGAGGGLKQLQAQVLNSMPGRADAPAATTAAAASKHATGIHRAMAAVLDSESGKPDSNPLFALSLEEQ